MVYSITICTFIIKKRNFWWFKSKDFVFLSDFINLKDFKIDLNVKKVKVHLKVDTGFSRYGFLYNEFEEIKNVFNNENIDIQGLFTHFSKTLDEKWTKIQFIRFMNVVKHLKENGINTGLLHCCNSTAFFKYPYMRLDAVRIGSAWQGRLPNNIGGLREIGTLKSKILEIRTVEKGSNVSYTNKYTTKRKTTLATIPLGYMDGINGKIDENLHKKISNYVTFISSCTDYSFQ